MEVVGQLPVSLCEKAGQAPSEKGCPAFGCSDSESGCTTPIANGLEGFVGGTEPAASAFPPPLDLHASEAHSSGPVEEDVEEEFLHEFDYSSSDDDEGELGEEVSSCDEDAGHFHGRLFFKVTSWSDTKSSASPSAACMSLTTVRCSAIFLCNSASQYEQKTFVRRETKNESKMSAKSCLPCSGEPVSVT
jgi:hypothetical protein